MENKKITDAQFDVIANRLRGKFINWDKLYELDRDTASNIVGLLINGQKDMALNQLKHLGY